MRTGEMSITKWCGASSVTTQQREEQITSEKPFVLGSQQSTAHLQNRRKVAGLVKEAQNAECSWRGVLVVQRGLCTRHRATHAASECWS